MANPITILELSYQDTPKGYQRVFFLYEKKPGSRRKRTRPGLRAFPNPVVTRNLSKGGWGVYPVSSARYRSLTFSVFHQPLFHNGGIRIGLKPHSPIPNYNGNTL